MYIVVKIHSGESVKDTNVLLRGCNTFKDAVEALEEESKLIEATFKDEGFEMYKSAYDVLFDRDDLSILIKIVELIPNNIASVRF